MPENALYRFLKGQCIVAAVAIFPSVQAGCGRAVTSAARCPHKKTLGAVLGLCRAFGEEAHLRSMSFGGYIFCSEGDHLRWGSS